MIDDSSNDENIVRWGVPFEEAFEEIFEGYDTGLVNREVKYEIFNN